MLRNSIFIKERCPNKFIRTTIYNFNMLIYNNMRIAEFEWIIKDIFALDFNPNQSIYL